MTLTGWLQQIRGAYAAVGKSLSPEAARLLASEVSTERTSQQIAVASETRDGMMRRLFALAENGQAFGDPKRIESYFGDSLERNYGIRSGPFLDVARAYWTFKLELEDLFLEHSNTFLWAVLSSVEIDVASVFFPTPGPIRAPIGERRKAQEQILREFAPRLDAGRFLQESPILRGGERAAGGCFGMLLLLTSLGIGSLCLAILILIAVM